MYTVTNFRIEPTPELEAASFSEMMTCSYLTIQYHNPEDYSLNLLGSKSLKS
jgi:hypothetical protein